MKNVLMHNIGLKLLSILLALLLWLTVMNVEDPTVSKTVSDIPVQIINDDVIRSRGYGYTIESGEKVDIRIKGRRSVVDNITADDFTATADFNSFSSMKMVPIEINCTDEHAAEMTWVAKTDSMAIILEAEATASKSIFLDRMGEVKENYYLYDCYTDTSLVTVKGAESQVAKVKEVVAQVDIEGLKDSAQLKLPVYAVDMDGERIDSKKISLEPDTITVQIIINPIKAVPLNIVTVGSLAEHYYMGDIEYAPEQVQVTADAGVLDKLTSLDVEVSLNDQDTDIVKSVNLEEYIERYYRNLDVKVVDQNINMGIKIPVIKMEEMTLDVKPEDVAVLGGDEDNYEYILSSGWMSKILVRGKQEDMSNIEASDFNLNVNVSGLSDGSFTIEMGSGYSGPIEVECGSINVKVEEKPHNQTDDTQDTDSEGNLDKNQDYETLQ